MRTARDEYPALPVAGLDETQDPGKVTVVVYQDRLNPDAAEIANEIVLLQLAILKPGELLPRPARFALQDAIVLLGLPV